jgi:hypothetical protein
MVDDAGWRKGRRERVRRLEMGHRFLGSLVAVAVAAGSLMSVTIGAQAPRAAKTTAAANGKTTAAPKTWTPPRTSDGQPSLEGVWANNSVTPLERPKQLAGRQTLTDQELAALKKRSDELFSGDGDAAFGDTLFETLLTNTPKFVSTDGLTGDYNQFWLVARDWDNRTSLIVDPPDGRLPPLTPQAQAKQSGAEEARKRPAAGPEDRSLSERCITFGVPRLGAGYNSYYQFVQTPQYVAIYQETIHDARIIPLDGRPHVEQNIRQWHGDSRGRWEGDSLVVDTTNYSPKSSLRGAAENLHVVERFTRVGPDAIRYEITVDDPTTWTKPWTVMIPLRRSDDLIYEYACHEGNTGLAGILNGARADERAAEKTTGNQKSN